MSTRAISINARSFLSCCDGGARSTVTGHSTGSHGSKGLYYAVPLLERVRQAYDSTDYRMFSDLGWWNESALL